MYSRLFAVLIALIGFVGCADVAQVYASGSQNTCPKDTSGEYINNAPCVTSDGCTSRCNAEGQCMLPRYECWSMNNPTIRETPSRRDGYWPAYREAWPEDSANNIIDRLQPGHSHTFNDPEFGKVTITKLPPQMPTLR